MQVGVERSLDAVAALEEYDVVSVPENPRSNGSKYGWCEEYRTSTTCASDTPTMFTLGTRDASMLEYGRKRPF